MLILMIELEDPDSSGNFSSSFAPIYVSDLIQS